MRQLLAQDDGDDVADDDGSNSLWWVGVILCLAGSIGLNLGNNLQSFGLQGPGTEESLKLSESENHTKLSENNSISKGNEISSSSIIKSNQNGYIDAKNVDEDDYDEQEIDDFEDDDDDDIKNDENDSPKLKTTDVVPMYNQGIFIFGTGMFITGSLLTFVAFGFAAQSLLASLEGVQFVSNIIFGKCMRNAKITYHVLLGVMMIVAGIATVVLNGSHESESFTSQQLMMLYVNNHAYQSFLVVVGGSAVLLRYIEKAFTKRLLQEKPWPYSEVIIPLSFAIFSAIFGTQSVVQAKCLMMCLTLTLNHENQFNHPFTYAMLVAWFLFVGVWLTRMGTALKRFDPMFIIPLLQVSFILLAIISGGIFFEEFDSFGVSQTIAFCGGVLLVCLGLYFLSPPQKKKIDINGNTRNSLSQSESSECLNTQISPLAAYDDDDEGDKGSKHIKKSNNLNRGILVQTRAEDEYPYDNSSFPPPPAPPSTPTLLNPNNQNQNHNLKKEIQRGLNSPIITPVDGDDFNNNNLNNVKVNGIPVWSSQELPPWALREKEEAATRVLEEESGFYDLGLGGRGDYFNVESLLSSRQAYATFNSMNKGITNAAILANDVTLALGEVFIDDFRDFNKTSTNTVNLMSQSIQHVVEEPEASVGAAVGSMGAAVGNVGGWLRTMKNGEVDWRATTAQLNLIAAAEAQVSTRDKKKKMKLSSIQQQKQRGKRIDPFKPNTLPSNMNNYRYQTAAAAVGTGAAEEEDEEEEDISSGGGGGGGFSHRHIPDRSTRSAKSKYHPPQFPDDDSAGIAEDVGRQKGPSHSSLV